MDYMEDDSVLAIIILGNNDMTTDEVSRGLGIVKSVIWQRLGGRRTPTR